MDIDPATLTERDRALAEFILHLVRTELDRDRINADIKKAKESPGAN